MYRIPQLYKCQKCGFESKFSPDDEWPAPVIAAEGKPWSLPVCTECYARFLRENCGLMEEQEV